MWIHRTATKRLSELARSFPAVLVTGARQTGKTSLLRETFPSAHVVALDLPSRARQAEESPEDFFASVSEPILLDEAQHAPGIFRHLRARIDEDRHRMGRFLMTGSQKFPLMRSVSESLAGRCAILELDTLSSVEVAEGAGARVPGVATVLARGGFPELWRNRRLSARDFYASYVATYLERDVRLSLRLGSLRDFERFLRACALRSAQLLNLSDLARDVGIAGSTARDWLSVLEASNQIVLLEPYFGNAGKRMIKAPKLFLRDTGLLSFLLGIDSAEALVRSPHVGAVWETFVLAEILRAKAAAGSAANVFFWRDAHGTEVDFVLENEGRLRLIEAKWTEQMEGTRGLGSLLSVSKVLGERAAGEHWVACRTPHAHTLAAAPNVRLIPAFSFDGWLRGERRRGRAEA